MQDDNNGNSTGLRKDVVNLVTTPILSQANRNSAQILAKIRDLQESVDIIARQMGRQISKRN